MKRSLAAQIGKETVEMVDAGRYQPRPGLWVDIAASVEAAIGGTVEYRPDDALPPRPGASYETAYEVGNETTLSAASRLVLAGHRVAALNFASARHPGGGFLNGARAQEESLARSSALYACLRDREMYDVHRASSDALYSAWVIYSPDVPVIRDDEGALLERPYEVSFLTSPAPNAGVVLERDKRRGRAVERALRERIDRVLGVAAGHGHDALVLGAWGCGVFRNDPAQVAGLFREALSVAYRGAFVRVAFAILDASPELRFMGPFAERFGASLR